MDGLGSQETINEGDAEVGAPGTFVWMWTSTKREGGVGWVALVGPGRGRAALSREGLTTRAGRI